MKKYQTFKLHTFHISDVRFKYYSCAFINFPEKISNFQSSHFSKFRCEERGIRLRLCVPKELREEIMEVCHSDIWSAFGDNQDAASVGGAILLAPDDSKY